MLSDKIPQDCAAQHSYRHFSSRVPSPDPQMRQEGQWRSMQTARVEACSCLIGLKSPGSSPEKSVNCWRVQYQPWTTRRGAT